MGMHQGRKSRDKLKECADTGNKWEQGGEQRLQQKTVRQKECEMKRKLINNML